MYAEGPAVAHKASWRDFFQGRNCSTFLNQFFHIFLSRISVAHLCVSRISAHLLSRISGRKPWSLTNARGDPGTGELQAPRDVGSHHIFTAGYNNLLYSRA